MSQLKSGRVQPAYRCAQKDLYSALRAAWNSYMEYQKRFHAMSTIYTVAYGKKQLKALEKAIAMPDFQARDMLHESLRIMLVDAWSQCMINWKFLESHIMRAFPEDLHKPKLEAAGSKEYRKASLRDWESTSSIMQSGSNFIDKNLSLLKANGMPDDFKSVFNTAFADFKALIQQFNDAEQEAWKMRQSKIIANNEVYKATVAMLRDGKKIFRYDEAIRKRFTFRKILQMIGEK